MKNLAGFRLEGDYVPLRAIYITIHEMAVIDRIPNEDGEILLGLAYELRHAFSGQRIKIKPPEHYPEVGTRYGVKVVWPTILLQSRILRNSLNWGPTTSQHHACAYALEAVIEDAITDQFPANSAAVIRAWQNIDPRHPATAPKVTPIGAMFCSWKKAERAKRLITLLNCYDPMHSDFTHDLATRNGHDSISPAELKRWEKADWVDPETGK